MGGHLTAAGRLVGGSAHGLQQHLFGGDAQRQAECAVAVVGVKPIVAGAETRPAAA